ncbi:interferon alpha/beta receptor 1a-like isoform 2-T2 [Pholidichthys leucotaenia]
MAAPRHLPLCGELSLLLLWILRCSSGEEETPPPPQALTVVSLNTHYSLTWTWSWTQRAAAEDQKVTFTTQVYQMGSKKGPRWVTACEETSHRSCDLTGFNLHYLGIFLLRVRANVDGRHSEWAELEFCPDKDAALGPPHSVRLSPVGSSLDVFIEDPRTSNNSSMRELIRDIHYHIQYWEQGQSGSVSSLFLQPSRANLTLPDLKSWTWYCVTVQSLYDFYNKNSSFTEPCCMQTEGPVPWWVVLLSFILSLLVVFVLGLLVFPLTFKYCRKIKDALKPSNQLPSHLREFLFSSDTPQLLSADSPSERLCDTVVVVEGPLSPLRLLPPPPEEMSAPPVGLDSHSSLRHGRQDSGSSGDSGVYSSAGSSAHQHLLYHTDDQLTLKAVTMVTLQSASQAPIREDGVLAVI